MQIILLEKIRNLGELGALVDVKPGYARNYLIPEGKAVFATKANLADFEVNRAALEKAALSRLSEAQKRAESLQGKEITLLVRATEEGKLFGSVTSREIVDALSKLGETVERREIDMPTGPIHHLGSYGIQLLLHGDASATITVKVEKAID